MMKQKPTSSNGNKKVHLKIYAAPEFIAKFTAVAKANGRSASNYGRYLMAQAIAAESNLRRAV